MKVKIKRLSNGLDLLRPLKGSEGSAGLDICAAIYEPITIYPRSSELIPAGFSLEIPYGYEVQIRSRSGLALYNRVFVLNSPGTIDSDYRGEISVILYNGGFEDFKVNRGDRIAQMVLKKVEKFVLMEVDELSHTERGEEGFGSTGVE